MFEPRAVDVLYLCLLALLANLGVLALTLKLYTEYFKDRSQNRRNGSPHA